MFDNREEIRRGQQRQYEWLIAMIVVFAVLVVVLQVPDTVSNAQFEAERIEAGQ